MRRRMRKLAQSWYWLGPWERSIDDGAEEGFALPRGAESAIDLRSLPEASNLSVDGYGVFVTSGRLLGSDYRLLGTGPIDNVSLDRVSFSAFRKVCPHVETDSRKLSHVLTDALTLSDPEGLASCKPLLPRSGRKCEIHIAGERLVWTQRRDNKHWNRVLDVIRGDVAKTMDAALDPSNPTIDDEAHKRLLDHLCKTYKTDDWQQFAGKRAKHIDGRRPHQTEYTDDFNRADSASLGANWTDLSAGNFSILNNMGLISTGGTGWGAHRARYNSALSSADHYAQITAVDGNATSACCRFDNSSDTTYYAGGQSGSGGIGKYAAGVRTVLSGSTYGITAGQVIKFDVSGSSLSYYLDGGLQVTLTDTSITGHLHCGMAGKSGADVDDWSCSDGGATGSLWHVIERVSKFGRSGRWEDTRGGVQ